MSTGKVVFVTGLALRGGLVIGLPGRQSNYEIFTFSDEQDSESSGVLRCVAIFAFGRFDAVTLFVNLMKFCKPLDYKSWTLIQDLVVRQNNGLAKNHKPTSSLQPTAGVKSFNPILR